MNVSGIHIPTVVIAIAGAIVLVWLAKKVGIL